MKYLPITFLVIFIAFNSAVAQNPKIAYKNAKKAFKLFQEDYNPENLRKSERLINEALSEKNSPLFRNHKVWVLKGDIYKEIVNSQRLLLEMKRQKNDWYPLIKNPEIHLFEAYSKALELTNKKSDNREILIKMRNSQETLNGLGIQGYENKDYALAYDQFKTILRIQKLLTEKGSKGWLHSSERYNEILFITALMAVNSKHLNEASSYFLELRTKKYDKPAIYDFLYKIYADSDIDKAYKYLKEGRDLYPEDTPLLFSEINYLLSQSKSEQLIEPLEKAIKLEPNNSALLLTLGNVYEDLYRKARPDIHPKVKFSYFYNARTYYRMAIAKDPNYFEALYSLGSLRFNRAVELTQNLNAMEVDSSPEGIKKYQEKKEEIRILMDKAIPYFQKAESINPNDINTLIALKEFYSVREDFKKVKEFQARIKKIQSGEAITNSYFKF